MKDLVALLKDIKAHESLFPKQRVLALLDPSVKDAIREELISKAQSPPSSRDSHFDGMLLLVPPGPGVSKVDTFKFFHRGDGEHR